MFSLKCCRFDKGNRCDLISNKILHSRLQDKQLPAIIKTKNMLEKNCNVKVFRVNEQF